MKQYLKMADVFYGEQFKVGGMVIFNDLNQECFKAVAPDYAKYAAHAITSHDELVQMNHELLAALEEGRRAIGDHQAPYDCYATGPITGDPFRDIVQCPACSFIAMHDDVIAKAKGGAA